eukprot:7781967-Karenia_brevis.AAC.1
MNDFHNLHYLDGRALPTWFTWMDDLHVRDYLGGRPSLPALFGGATCTLWITLMDHLHYLDYLYGRPSLPGESNTYWLICSD